MHLQRAPDSSCRQVCVLPMASGCGTRICIFMVCAGRSPQDPEYPKLKPVGVYPVVDGWAHVDLEELAGKGQDYFSPLYAVAGVALHITHYRLV